MKGLVSNEHGKIIHRSQLEDIEEAYNLFENKLDGVIKVIIE